MGVRCSLKPTRYDKTSANQTGGAEMLSSTKTSTPRSYRDLGQRAAVTPRTIETSVQTIAPPTTTEAVTGAAWITRCVIRRPPKKPAPSEPWRTRSFRKYQYWTIRGGAFGGGKRIWIAWKRTNATSVVA